MTGVSVLVAFFLGNVPIWWLYVGGVALLSFLFWLITQIEGLVRRWLRERAAFRIHTIPGSAMSGANVFRADANIEQRLPMLGWN